MTGTILPPFPCTNAPAFGSSMSGTSLPAIFETVLNSVCGSLGSVVAILVMKVALGRPLAGSFRSITLFPSIPGTDRR